MSLNNKGQILVISLWVLALLAVLAVTLGHRAAMGLKLSQYQVDRLKTHALAKAGVGLASAKLADDKAGSDSFGDVWAGSEKVFKEIRLKDAPEGYATVSYLTSDDRGTRTVYGVLDEDRKININKAPRELLRELMARVSVPPEIADNICAWRGDHGGPVPDYRSDGYANKGQPFVVPEELLMVKGIDRAVYERLKDHITVWGAGLVNVNTASRDVLETLVSFCRQMDPSGWDTSGDIVEWILDTRPFASASELSEKYQEQGAVSAWTANLLNALAGMVDVRSTYFHIFSTGRIAHSKVASNIECVLNRAKGRMVYWHEN